MAALTPAEGAAPPALPAAPAVPPKPQPRLRWRLDLRATAQPLEGRRQIVIEDPLGGRYFRLGPNEYALARALNGERDLGLALAYANATEKMDPLGPQEALAICQFLLRNGLVEEVLPGQAQQTRLTPPKPKRRLGALFQRLPLGNPNRLLDRLMPFLGWFAGWWFLPLWLGAATFAGVALAEHWDRWTGDAAGVLDRGNLLWIPVAWFLLKVWHELNHGLVAKRYGADVVECGMLFVLFAPVGGYVDATASWRLTNRWQRLHVSLAGIAAETFLGCLAVVVWAANPPGALSTLAYNVAILATISTVIFNANPLMRFDGYYVLVDLIDRPNLYQRGMLYVRYLGRRLFLGAKPSDPSYGPGAPRVIKIYGLATMVWRWMVMSSILLMATAWFSGLGILLCVVGFATWLVIPALRLIKRERMPGGSGGRGLLRAAALVCGLLALVVGLNYGLPLRPSAEAPGLVSYVQATTLRADAGGYLAEVAVRRGDRVTAGQVLLRLENPDLESEARKVATDMAAMAVEADRALTQGDLETESARRASRAVLAGQLAELRRQQASLTVLAPHDGVVIGGNLDAWEGAYMKRGADLGEVADPDLLEVEISIPEHLVQAFRDQVGSGITLDLPGGRSLVGTLTEVAPKGSLSRPPEALTVLADGPIALHQVKGGKGSEYQTLEARFKGIVTLPASALRTARAGEVGWVTVRGEERSLLGLAMDAWRHWTARVLAAVGAEAAR